MLDVGCGFGLETLRLAALARPGRVVGIDKSADFIAEAKARAAAASLAIDFDVGDADALPYPDASFDCVRAERLLIYLTDPAKAVAEMKRVAKPGGRIALIEPDFGTTTHQPARPPARCAALSPTRPTPPSCRAGCRGRSSACSATLALALATSRSRPAS